MCISYMSDLFVCLFWGSNFFRREDVELQNKNVKQVEQKRRDRGEQATNERVRQREMRAKPIKEKQNGRKVRKRRVSLAS